MLLELAIGDAYGAGFEYANIDLIKQHNNLFNYVKHPTPATNLFPVPTQTTLK